MNLQELFTAQAELDAYIEQLHPRLPGENRLEKKVLALKVELGECANELPELFKYWSNKENNYEKALTEYVDCLHFILSIGNDLKIENIVAIEQLLVFESYKDRKLIFVLSKLYLEISLLLDDENFAYEYYPQVFQWFLELGWLLGFNWEQIEEAYWAKYEINKQRQKDGY